MIATDSGAEAVTSAASQEQGLVHCDCNVCCGADFPCSSISSGHSDCVRARRSSRIAPTAFTTIASRTPTATTSRYADDCYDCHHAKQRPPATTRRNADEE